ncbi:tetratricopeptide repeat protein [Neobacillus drentensis]|uniref:tetratricopeptide repeat protein n=1 Tax=Neobacillus drentensis TaxID=220684 RepID=UPI0030006D61
MDDSLSHKIKHSYPFPIAVYYKKFSKEERLVKRGQENYEPLFVSMIDLFEMTTRYLSIVSLSSYVKNGMQQESLNHRISELLTKKLSLGHWFEIFRETTRVYKDMPEDMFIPELAPFLFERKTIQLFDQLITLRNKKKGHSFRLSPLEYKELYEEYIGHLITILERLQFLSNYTMISPIEIEQDGYLIKVFNDFMGDSINEKDQELQISTKTNEEEILLLKKNGISQYDPLLLSPLTYYDYIEDRWEEYLFLHEENKINKHELKKLEYVGINTTAKTHKISINENEESRLMWFELFKQVLDKMLQMNEQMHQSDQPVQIEKKDYYFQDQKTLMQTYSRHYVERQDMKETIAQFQQSHSSGYLLMIGSPGQGKTAIAADLVLNYQSVHHFISGNAGRNDESAMILSLFQQIAQKMHLEIKPSEDPIHLKREFTQLIESYSEWLLKEGRNEFLIIDGLDELNGSEDHLTLSYFPEYLPSNIYVLMLSRPINQLINLKSKVTEEYTIPTMTIGEVRKVIQTVHQHVNEDLVSSLFHYSQGNPLLLKGILQEIGSLKDVNVKKIPRSIEEVFEHFVYKLQQSEDYVAIDLLGLLSCSAGGLSLNMISSILKVRKHHIVKSLRKLEQFLVSFGGKIQLYHKKLSEYLRNPDYEYSFSDDELADYQDLLIDYSLQHLDQPNEFITENLIQLLYKRSKYELLNDIFTNEDFRPSAVAFLTDLFRKNEGQTILKELFQNLQYETIGIVVAAVEQAVSYGELDFSELVLKNYLEVVEDPLFKSKVHYLLALIYKERGQLQEAFDQFGYIRTHLNEHLPRREQLLVDLEFANTAREFAEVDIANQTYRELFQKASLETESEFYLNAKRHLLDREYVQGNFIEADKGFKEIIQIAHQKGLKNLWAEIHTTYGQVYFVQERYQEAIDIFYQALHVYRERNDLINLGRIYNDLAESYAYMDFEKAAYYANKAFEINTKIQKKMEIANSYRCFATISLNKGDLYEALDSIDKAIELFGEIGYKSGVGKAYYHKAVILFKLERYDEVVEAIELARQWFIRKTSLSHGVYVVKALLLQTVLYEKTGQADKIPALQSKFPHIEPFEGIDQFKERIKATFLLQEAF